MGWLPTSDYSLSHLLGSQMLPPTPYVHALFRLATTMTDVLELQGIEPVVRSVRSKARYPRGPSYQVSSRPSIPTARGWCE